jgi:hypothetical protein
MASLLDMSMLLPVAFAMAASRPTARPAHSFFELLLGSANAALASLRLLRILDPTDELVAGERRDVDPGIERRAIGEERRAQILRKLVNDATRDALTAQCVLLREAGARLLRRKTQVDADVVDRRGHVRERVGLLAAAKLRRRASLRLDRLFGLGIFDASCTTNGCDRDGDREGEAIHEATSLEGNSEREPA